MTFKPTKIEESSTLTFTRKDITRSVIEELEKNGDKVKSAAWNEDGTKLDIHLIKKSK